MFTVLGKCCFKNFVFFLEMKLWVKIEDLLVVFVMFVQRNQKSLCGSIHEQLDQKNQNEKSPNQMETVEHFLV